MWDYLFDSNPNNPLWSKESPCKLNFLHNGRPNARSRSNSSLHGANTLYTSLCGADTPYMKHQLNRSLLYTAWVATRPLQRSIIVKYLASQSALQGPTTVPSCAKLRDQQQRILSTHTTSSGHNFGTKWRI